MAQNFAAEQATTRNDGTSPVTLYTTASSVHIKDASKTD